MRSLLPRVVSVLAVASLALAGLTAASGPASAADATCDCVETGAFAAPKVVEPYVPSGLDGLSAAADARYQLTATDDVSGTLLTIRRVSDNQIVLSLLTQLTHWGFSPDQDAFVVTGNTDGLREMQVYSLTAATPSAPVFQRATVTPDDGIMFSPHGEFFVYGWVQNGTNNMVNLDVRRSFDGDQRHLTNYSYVITEAGGKKFGASGWGFSPDDDEFLYAWVTGGTTSESRLVNLETKQSFALGQEPGSAVWSFSSCGTVLATRADALVVNQQTITLRSTATGTIVSSGTYAMGTTTTLATTPAGHVATIDGTPHVLAAATPPAPDRCPPTWPEDSELTAGEITWSSVALEWTAAVDATGVTGYVVYRGATQIGTTAAGVREFTATGLSEDTQYTFRIEALDAAGHESTGGPTVQVRTAGSEPTWPGGSSMCAASATNTTVDLCWTAATDNQAVTGYRIFVNGTQYADVPASPRRYTVTGLEPGTLYQFRVEARDAQGNFSTGGPTTSRGTANRGAGAPGTISGIVWHDLLANGHRENWEVLLGLRSFEPYVNVSAHRVASDGRILEQRFADQVTGGGYEFTGLTDGTWVVTLSIRSTPFKGWPQTLPGDQQPYVVTIGGDGPAGSSGLDFGVGPEDYNYPGDLARTGYFAATFFDDVNLNGVRDGGEGPLPGGRAFCDYLNFGGSGPVACGAAVAGPDGVLQHTGLFPGVYRISGSAPLEGEGWYTWQGGDPVGTVEYLVIGGSGFAECDDGPSSQGLPAFGFTQGLASAVGEVFMDLNADGVRGPGEEGFVEAHAKRMQVCLESEVFPWVGACALANPVTGAFTIEHLLPGAYTVAVYAEPAGWRLSLPPPGTPLTVEVATNGEVVNVGQIGIEGSQLGTIAGYFFFDSDGDGVRQIGEPGLGGYEVCLWVPGHGERCVPVEADGSYVANYLPTGTVIDVYPGDYPQHLSISPNEHEWPERVTLAAGETLTIDWGWTGGENGVPPTAPRSLTAVAGPGSFTASWQPPADEGDHPVTGYVLAWTIDEYEIGWTYAEVGNVLSHTVTGLAPGVPHHVWVYAVTAVEGGPWSEQVVVVPLEATPTVVAPSAPRSVVASPGAARLALTWQSPDDDGGGAVTDYVVQRATAAGGPWTTVPDGVSTARSATLTGLSNGTRYHVRVAAVNSAGTGAWSTVASGIPRTTAAAPGKPTAKLASKAVTLSWAAPASTGGAAVTGYVVQRATKASGPWTTVPGPSGTARSVKVSGLTNGTKYYLRVAAVNAAGTGAWSTAVAATPRTKPKAPGKPKAAAKARSVKLTWSKPDTGGAKITDYVIQRATTKGGPWTTVKDGTSTKRSYTVGKLTKGKKYYFRIAAKNAAGRGAWGKVVTATPR